MTKQKTPHTQSQQNVGSEQSDLEPDQGIAESGREGDEELYRRSDGAESGADRAPRKLQTRAKRRRTEPSISAAEGSLSSRTLKRPAQGITSHSAEEESKRNQKVVNDRLDARAGVNRSK